METINLEVWLYGPLASYAGDSNNHIAAQVNLEMPVGSALCHVLERLSLPTEERGITFINGDLSAMPGNQPDLDHVLQNGDRIALFHLKSMWPFQYRHGVAMTPEFAQTTAHGLKASHLRASAEQDEK